jgi:hypothetical protein
LGVFYSLSPSLTNEKPAERAGEAIQLLVGRIAVGGGEYELTARFHVERLGAFATVDQFVFDFIAFI